MTFVRNLNNLLDKCSDERLVGVGRRIIDEAVMCLAKKHFMDSSSDIQISAGKTSGSQGAIYNMRNFYEQGET